MAYLAERFDQLRSSQNQDGGWGYFPGKQSWLEPTVYAALALTRHPGSADRVQRAWALVRSWQNQDGGWRACSAVPQSSWGTALALTLADVLSESGRVVEQGANWLMASAGAESSVLNQVLRILQLSAIERGVNDPGWPWRAGTSTWVEPTAHALVALRKLNHSRPERGRSARIQQGERMLLQVRCTDGGWNYGSPRAIGVDLPSYAETSALALIGLGKRAPAEALEYARRALRESEISQLGRAWLRIALADPSNPAPPAAPPRDILLCSLQALDGRLLEPGARA